MQLPRNPEWATEVAQLWDDLSDYDFYGWPPALAACTRLRRLAIDFEAMQACFGHLPRTVGALSGLQSLQLCGCEVNGLPKTFSRLSQLSCLIIANEDLISWEEACECDAEEEINGVCVPCGLFESMLALQDKQIERRR